jgi:nucleotide-binding universal stress UspA family protein
MFQLERILVPIDFSDSSLVAARHAGALAHHFRSEVTLLHVNEFLVIHPATGPLGFGVTSWEPIRSEHLAARKKELDEFGAVELSGIPVKRVVCSGDPARIIVESASAENSDLIIMPTHGGGSFRRFLLGSVTAKVLHDAECPVWTGAHLEVGPSLTPTEMRHVMCAVNFEPQSFRAVHWAAAFAKELGAKLTVTHAVLQTPPNLPDRYAFQWHEEAQHGTDQRLQTLLLDSGIHADTLVVGDGDVPRALSAAAKEKGAGLLVIGRSSAGKASKRLGSHTYSIICHAPCPVVSI